VGSRRIVELRCLRIAELFVLRRISQRDIRPQEPIHQLAFLLLRESRGRGHKERSDGDDDPHVLERAQPSARL
jgi:hypothetical protein